MDQATRSVRPISARGTVSVVSDDTDVSILLLHHFAEEKLSTGNRDRNIVDVKATVDNHNKDIPDISALQGISGCHTGKCCYPANTSR